MQQRRYSDNTIKSYIEALVSFLVFYKYKQIEEIDNKDIVHFNSEFIIKNKLSLSYQNQLINALKLFYNTITNKKLIIEIF
jgi:integrase/recombinase XerD